MKKVIVFLAMFIAVTLCKAQNALEVSDSGQYRLSSGPGSGWEPSRITCEPGTETYIDQFTEAILNPGKPILVKKTRQFLTMNPLFQKVEWVSRISIVYIESERKIELIKPEPVKETSFYFLVILILISIGLMTLAVFLDNYFQDLYSLLLFGLAVIITAAIFLILVLLGQAACVGAFIALILMILYSKSGENSDLVSYYIVIITTIIMCYL